MNQRNGQLAITWDEQTGNVSIYIAPTTLHERATEALEKQLTLDTATRDLVAQIAWCKDSRPDEGR